jgi:DNA-directed RNA polymerase subunit K/omega
MVEGSFAELPWLLTKYERARLVSARVGELEANAGAAVPSEAKDTLFDIAAREVDSRVLDMELRRTLPGGKTETLHLSSFPPDDAR